MHLRHSHSGHAFLHSLQALARKAWSFLCTSGRKMDSIQAKKQDGIIDTAVEEKGGTGGISAKDGVPSGCAGSWQWVQFLMSLGRAHAKAKMLKDAWSSTGLAC